jgi:NAD(P)-dependent dehydrogenase (short-subunit alcohol dehydrogenase family)
MNTSDSLSPFRLDGKSCIVTGAGSGIGLAIAELFARAGGHVFLADLKPAGDQVEKISAGGGKAEAMVCDVANAASCEKLVRNVAAQAGRVDVLVNNAGIGHVGTILTTSPEDLQRLWSVNLMGAYNLARLVLPGMIEAGRGSIINLGSIAGVVGMEDRFAYTITKHAIVGMTRAMAMDHGTTGVRINAICPGRVLTPFVEARLREYSDPKKYEAQLSAPHTMKRMGRPEEIASMALYLASDAASFITGAALMVDGGYTCGK